jgi:hypothetical protein
LTLKTSLFKGLECNFHFNLEHYVKIGGSDLPAPEISQLGKKFDNKHLTVEVGG